MEFGEGTKSKTQTRRKRKAIAVEQESPSADDFFAENKKMAGFDTPGESLYTTVRVLVENALDSAESIRQLPSVEVTIEEIPERSLSSMTGSLETGKASQKKAKAAKGKKDGFYRVTCKDNGRGMTRDDIPKMFGRVLCGTNDGAKQSRGESGLGIKMAFLWAKMSTGIPVEISTSMKNQNCTTFCTLDMDTNVPNIQIHEKKGGKKRHGAEFKVVVEGGDWKTYGLKISEYMRRIAVITPYAEFTYRFVADTRGKKDVEIMFPRSTKVMPPKSKWAPSAVNIDMMERLVAQAPKEKTLLQFVKDEFVDIGRPDVEELIEKMGPGVTLKTKAKSLNCQQLDCMLQFLRQDKFDTQNCLSPVGVDELRLGIIKQLQPELVATRSTRGMMLEGGHPFILEVAVCLEGEDWESGMRIFRFANRVPLLFEEEEEADVVTMAVDLIDWKSYKINRKQSKVGVFVSIVSTKFPFPFPFKGTGADQDHMACLVQAGLESCCLELEGKLIENLDATATSLYNIVRSLGRSNAKFDGKIAEQIYAGEMTLESFKEKYRRCTY